MKKSLRILFVMMLALSIVLSLASCDLLDSLLGNDTHTHEFVDGECECGETDPDYQPPHEHTYVNGKCECGESDPNYQPPHEHSYVNGKCECGESDPDYQPPKEPELVMESLPTNSGAHLSALETVVNSGVELLDRAVAVYSIDLELDGEKVDPEGKVTVSVPVLIPEVLAYDVYHIMESGDVEYLPSRVENGMIIFETTAFSDFVFVTDEDYSVANLNIAAPNVQIFTSMTLEKAELVVLLPGATPADISLYLNGEEYVEFEEADGGFVLVADFFYGEKIKVSVTPKNGYTFAYYALLDYVFDEETMQGESNYIYYTESEIEIILDDSWDGFMTCQLLAPDVDREEREFDIATSTDFVSLENLTFTINGVEMKGDNYIREDGGCSYHLYINVKNGDVITISANLPAKTTFSSFRLRDLQGAIIDEVYKNSITFVVDENTGSLDLCIEEEREHYAVNVLGAPHAQILTNGSALPSHYFEEGETVTFTVKPDYGFELLYWFVDGEVAGYSDELTIVVRGNHTIEVEIVGIGVEFHFRMRGEGTSVNKYRIDLDEDGDRWDLSREDSATGTTYAEYGMVTKFQGFPAEGYVCSSITIIHNGKTEEISGGYAEVQVKDFEPYEIIFNFERETYMINLTAYGCGDTYVNGEATEHYVAKYNDEITISVEPQAGYEFVGWYVDGEELLTNNRTFTHTVTGGISLEARVEAIWVGFGMFIDESGYTSIGNPENEILLTRTSRETGERETITLTDSLYFSLMYGDTVEFIAKPMEGYSFDYLAFSGENYALSRTGYYKWTVDKTEFTPIDAFFHKVDENEEDINLDLDFCGECDECYLYFNGNKVTKEMALTQSFVIKDQTNVTLVPVECGNCEGFRYYVHTTGAKQGEYVTSEVRSFVASTEYCRKTGSETWGYEYYLYIDVCFGYEIVLADMTFGVDIANENTGFDVRIENVLENGEKITIENTHDRIFAAVMGDTIRLTLLNIPYAYEFNYIEITVVYRISSTERPVIATIVLDADDFVNGYYDLVIEHPGYYEFYTSVTQIVN